MLEAGLKTLHVFGVICWIGSVVTVAWLSREATPEEATLSHRFIARFSNSTMIMAFIGGLGILVPNFMSTYKSSGWMHTKLLIGIIVAGMTGALSAKLRKAAQANEPVAHCSRIAAVILALAFVNVALVMFRPF